jgi:hypothetical protein
MKYLNDLKQILNMNMVEYMIDNNDFLVNYSANFGRPIWTAYSMDNKIIKKLKGGRKNFTLDPNLLHQDIYQLKPNSNIFSPQWSRGHLVPSYIMSWDKSFRGAWRKTYHMSNIIPQNKILNMSNWYKLERDTLNIIKQNKENVNVITGCDNINNPVFFDSTISTKKNLYMDSKTKFTYQIRFAVALASKPFGFETRDSPNIMYQIVISNYEIKCWLASNDQRQIVKNIKLRELEELIENKIILL